MLMIKTKDEEKTREELENGEIKNAFNLFPNLSDKVMDYNEKHFNIVDLIDETFEDRRKYKSQLPASMFVLSTIQSRMKQMYSISEVPAALTSEVLIEKMSKNIFYDPNEGLLKESNIRAFLSKYDNNHEKKLEEKRNNNGKINLEREIEYNNYFINFFNLFTEKYLERTKIRDEITIHILDCSILDVNLDNEKYEGSSIAFKGGKNLRGYKLGALRGVTSNGGVIEEICMSTASDHDLKMSREKVINSKYLQPGHFLLEDRGFLDLDTFRKLDKKNINVIVPAKKNMEIYDAAVNEAKNNGEWIKHPNKKRKGQSICLIKGMELFWLKDSEKLKKPNNIKLDYGINVCVIRIEKSKNKDILTDEEITADDDKYTYVCILTNNVDLSCEEIINYYELRPEIEEDFRQLKDFWGLNEYKSTNYNINSFIIMACLIGYNFYQVYKETDEGKKYVGKSFITEERNGFHIIKNVRTVIVTKNYYYVYSQSKLLDLYVSLDIGVREQIKKHLDRLEQI